MAGKGGSKPLKFSGFKKCSPFIFNKLAQKALILERFQADLEVKLRVSGKQLWCTARADAPIFSMMLAMSSRTEVLRYL